MGLIAQTPVPRTHRRVFLAVDLTPAVADELLARTDIHTAIVYHPVIFAATRKITMADPLQRSILRCIAAGIHIYCPHTTIDACRQGINDWLIAGLSHAWEKEAPADDELYKAVQSARYTIVEPNEDDPEFGVGRVASLPMPCTWTTLIARVKALLRIPHVQVAPAANVRGDTNVSTIAVCAGSGGSVLRSQTNVDVWVTGEMGHHEILAANARGVSVILANHTNTERQYLRDVLQSALIHGGFDVVVSDTDADPLQVA